MTPRTIIRARREAIFGNTVSLFIAQKAGDAIHVATNLTFRKFEDHERHIQSDPLVTLENDQAQSLMDQLWHLGIRPTEGLSGAQVTDWAITKALSQTWNDNTITPPSLAASSPNPAA